MENPTSEPTLVSSSNDDALAGQMLRAQEHHAPRWRVVYVPKKEEYLILQHVSGGLVRSAAVTDPRYAEAKRRTIPEGITVLGAQVLPQASEVGCRVALLRAAEGWDQAASALTDLGEVADLYRDQVLGQLANHAGTLVLSESLIAKVAGRVGRAWRKYLLLHFKTDSATLWRLVQQELGAPHPRQQAYLAAVRSQIAVLNTKRGDKAA